MWIINFFGRHSASTHRSIFSVEHNSPDLSSWLHMATGTSFTPPLRTNFAHHHITTYKMKIKVSSMKITPSSFYNGHLNISTSLVPVDLAQFGLALYPICPLTFLSQLVVSLIFLLFSRHLTDIWHLELEIMEWKFYLLLNIMLEKSHIASVFTQAG